MNASPKIRLRGVTKSFGAKKVLQGVDLDVATGESVVVIGGSGSGKSVLLKCILGLIRPDAGSITIDGEESVGMSDDARARVMRKFGMLFQGGALFDSLPVWENVAFGLIQGRGMARAVAKDVAIATLAKVGLGAEVGDLAGRGHVVGDRQRGGPQFADSLDDQIVDHVGHDRIEPGGRLVEEDDLGLGGNGAGQGDAFLHTA